MHCRARDTDSLSLPLALGSTDDMHDDALDEIFLMEYILRENGSAPERMSTYNESFTIYIEIEIDRERERERQDSSVGARSWRGFPEPAAAKGRSLYAESRRRRHCCCCFKSSVVLFSRRCTWIRVRLYVYTSGPKQLPAVLSFSFALLSRLPYLPFTACVCVCIYRAVVKARAYLLWIFSEFAAIRYTQPHRHTCGRGRGTT